MTDVTGEVVDIDGKPNLVLERRFDAPAEEVWRELTESERLARWIGRWEGDPASGAVTFFMTAEDADAPGQEYAIDECEPPRRFAGRSSDGWHLWFEVREGDGETVLRFGHRLNPTDDIGAIGPGWEYYLDRLVAAQQGRDAATVVWGDYYPVLQPGYERLVASG